MSVVRERQLALKMRWSPSRRHLRQEQRQRLLLLSRLCCAFCLFRLLSLDSLPGPASYTPRDCPALLPSLPDLAFVAGCCGGSDLLSKMCGNRSTCGVILVVVGTFALFLVAVCTMGGFCWRWMRGGAVGVVLR